MDKLFEEIWQLALPYLKRGVMKDFVIHTKGVIKAMELLLEKEKGNKDILIPAAILHDVGWSKVPLELQKSNDESDKVEALKLHLKYAPQIIEEILGKADYDKAKIERIIDIAISHKFQDPKESDKQLLIDADALADAFKEQFYSDVKSYGLTPEKNYKFRKKSKFYTRTVAELFKKELEKRREEF